MPVAALAFLAAVSQETVTIRTNPPLGGVVEFVVSLDVERTDGTSLLDARVVVAQRAKAAGPNFRLSRYVSFATAEGSGFLAQTGKDLAALNGRTYPLLVSPEGKSLPFKRAKGENDPGKVPSFNVALPASLTIGKEFTIPGSDLQPAGTATLREVRSLGAQRAAIFAFSGTTDAGMTSAAGTLVVSATDGMVLATEMTTRSKVTKAQPEAKIHLSVRRQNVPGLDRLVADLRLDEDAVSDRS